MFERLRWRWVAAAVLALVIATLGAVPALADGEPTYTPESAMLTLVIDAPANTDASADEYVFHFAGGGTVTESDDRLYSDGIEQDGTTIKEGDIIPTIPDVTLNGVPLSGNNSLTNGQTSQTVVQKSISDILLTDNNVVFPHAGVYTYVVTERSATTKLTDGTYINASKAEYTLRIRVKNSNTGSNSALGNEDLTIESVTVEQLKDDNGTETTGKVDPAYPTTDVNGKIDETAPGEKPAENTLAGYDRGRNVAGFTFANEYIKGGSFQVKKLYDGNFSDRTKYSLVELTVYSEAAAGSCLTYRIDGEGIDETEYNQDENGDHRKLNGIRSDIPQNNDYMATFNDQGWVTIKAELKEDSVIRITGEFGPYSPEYEDDPANPDRNRRKILSMSGLLQGQTYYVIERYSGERYSGDYVPTGYVYVGENTNADPRKSPDGMTKKDAETADITDPTDFVPSEYENNPDAYQKKTIKKGSLVVQGDATGSATTVFVVNTIDDDQVIPTGILIDNLPYVLMVGVPLVVFAGMFVMKRRRNAAA